MKQELPNDAGVRQFMLRQAIKEQAHKQLSYYRQKQDDLIARMATEWPTWGCTLDFYTHMIQPILRNPFVLNFINLSEGFSLQNVEIKTGYLRNDELQYIEEVLQFEGASRSVDVVDRALHLLTDVTEILVQQGAKPLPVSGVLSGWRVVFDHRVPLLTRIRDADIGSQAFFGLLEGLMRNASKHGVADGVSDEKTFRVRIVFCQSAAEVEQLAQVKGLVENPEHAFVLISMNRDLLEHGEKPRKIRQIHGQTLVDFLSARLGDPIIETDGRIRAGYWGIKEIKSCAAFLSGEPLSAVSATTPSYVLVGATKAGPPSAGNSQIWPEDMRSRLCFVVRLEKPRLAIAVVPRDKWPADLSQWPGIVFHASPDSALHDKLDYDFLYVESELNSKFVRERGHVLPQRIVIGNLDFKSAPAMGADSESSGGHSIAKLCSLYEHVIAQRAETLAPAARVKLRILFDEDTLADEWYSVCRPLTLPNGGRLEFDFLKKRVDPDFDEYFEGFQLGVFRHKLLRELGLTEENRGGKYYAEQATGSDPFFSFLLSMEPRKDPWFARAVLREFVEAALTNVLIIDERIAQAIAGLSAPGDADVELGEKLYWMGIHLAGSVSVDGVEIWNCNCSSSRLVDVRFTSDGKMEQPLGNALPIHLLLIHATRLSQLFDALHSLRKVNVKDDFCRALKHDQGIHVIVHSGRGKTEGDIPDFVPFLEYSTVEKHVLNSPSKFYLVQIAMNVKGQLSTAGENA